MEKFEHGGQIHHWREKHDTLLDFSANINPLGLSARIKEAITEHLNDVIHYPEPRSRTLQKAIADHYKIPFERIFVSNGAAESLYFLTSILKPKSAMILAPTFSEYEKSLAAQNAKIISVPLQEDFSIDWERIEKIIEEVDIAYFGNPNNPIGELISIDHWESIMEIAERANTYVVSDESFLDFLPNAGTEYSGISLQDKYPHLFILRSLTKFYSLPGLRLGFCSADPSLVKKLENHSDCWNVNSLAQQAGVAGLSDITYQEKTRNLLPLWQNHMKECLRGCDFLTFFEPTVNFILCRLMSEEITAKKLAEKTAELGLLIRDAGNFDRLDPYYFRLAIRQEDENMEAVQILQKAWKECVKIKESR